MSLINYVEPIDIGSFFSGIGTMVVALVLAYIFYRFYIKLCQFLDVTINRACKYEILEGAFLDIIAKKKGIDLEKELVKRQILRIEKKKSFRRKLEEQIYEEMFGKDKEEKK